ncbi:MAG TPA: LysR family transcriptional regulator [Stellaceae bacterium]|nr:LysR family transcriptional regulator [Stellaceae bacterium]
MNVTLRQLHAFVAVAVAGNFTRASDRLNVTQSAVSALVRELESALAIRLFDRTTRRVELTDAGREFQPTAEKLIADLDHAVHNVHDLVERRRGRITVAAPPLLAAVMLPNVIAAFHRDFPGVTVVLVDAPTNQIVASVRSGEADLGVGTFSPDEKGLVRRQLTRDSLMLFCQAQSPPAAFERPKWRDLKGLPLIALTRESGIRALVDYGYEAAELSSQPAYEVSQITTALALVEAGLGVSVLPTYALTSSKTRRIAANRLTSPTVSRDIIVIAREGHALPPATNDFLNRLQREATSLSRQIA